MSNKFKGTKRAKGERATDSNILTFIVPEVDGTSRKEVGRNGSGSEYSNVHNNDTRSGLQFAKGAGGQRSADRNILTILEEEDSSRKKRDGAVKGTLINKYPLCSKQCV